MMKSLLSKNAIPAYPFVLQSRFLLSEGDVDGFADRPAWCAVGYGVEPLLVCRKPFTIGGPCFKTPLREQARKSGLGPEKQA